MSEQEKRIGEQTVTKITVKKGNVLVRFTDIKVLLSESSYCDFHLFVGKTVSDSEMKKILKSEALDAYYTYSLKLLNHESYSESDIRQRLLDHGATPEATQLIITRLVGESLLNDELFAKSYAEDLSYLRCYGYKKVAFELKKHGISPQIIEALDFSREKELEKATRYVTVLDKRYARLPAQKREQKAFNALLTRGFVFETAKQAADNIAPIDPAKEKARLAVDFEKIRNRYSKKYSGYQLYNHLLSNLLAKGYQYDYIKEILEEEEK